VALAFGDQVLDVERRELRRGGQLVALEPQVFDLLVYLIRNRERVVDKDDLIANVWGGRIVSDSTVTTRINGARKAVGDDGATQQFIRTVPRKGVRFVAEVRDGAEKPATVAISLEPPDKPSIAVLPFANLSGDPEQEYFVDGIVEEIITALSRIHWLFVIARTSSFTYKGQAIDLKRVGHELGVRYVLEGSVRKAGERVRITGQLIDAATGTHLWADRFDGSLDDIFELQDKVASSVAGTIEPTLQAIEATRSAARPTADQTAYDLYLRAYALTVTSSARIPEALRLIEQAIERDPRYGPALAWAAVCCVRLLREQRSEDRAADHLRAEQFARRAMDVANNDPAVLVNAAYALTYVGEDVGAMIALIDRALALNPSFARGWHVSGVVRLWAGQHEVAIEHTKVALRLSPRARLGASLNIIAAGLFYCRRFAESVPVNLLMIQEDPSYPQAYRGLAAAYAHLGQLAEAREIVRRLRAIVPEVRPDLSHMRNADDRELLLSGLRLAEGEAI
jgi:TolB-like protein